MSDAKITKGAKLLDDFMVREPRHDCERHVLDPDELKISRVIVNVQVAETTRGRIRHMIGNCGRNKNALPTGELCPEIQICVFVVKKEVLVQEADLIEHSPPV